MSDQKFKEIIIHAGVLKTGSSTIQSFCFEKKNQLQKKYSILYLGKKAQHGSRFRCIFGKDPYKDKLYIRKGIYEINQIDEMNRQFKEEYEFEMNTITCERLLISAEQISRFKKTEFERFREWISSYSDNIRFIIFLREPTSWAASYFQEAVKKDRVQMDYDIKKFLPRYRSMIELIMKVFNCKLSLIDFDKCIGSVK